MRALGFLLLFLPALASAQFLYELDQSIAVTGEGSVPLKSPWSGGLNAVQVSTMDLNHDAKEDLVIFERMGDLVLTFLQQDGEYVHAPEYEVLFPEGITNWLLIRDFNGDGLKDIFTGDALGVKVYVNKTQTGGQLTWQPFLFFSETSKGPLLLTKKTSKAPLQMSYDDLPSIVDADGDGDLDIFSMDFPGESRIEFHQNFSMERYGSRDSLEFERVTLGWAGVRECTCGVFAFNSSTCPSSGREDHAGGKSLFAFDADNDGDIDMLFAEAACDQLFLFENESGDSNPANAVVNSAVPYPETFSMVNYANPYREDLDFDGITDLIISPNLFFREFNETNFKQSVWFYKNIGTNSVPSYAAADKDFLQGDMLDVGDNAVPAFFDVDGDGDQDMFIGCYINHAYEAASVYFFENTGSPTEPQFEFVTDDFLSLSARGHVNIKPKFADMNGDTKQDLVFTAQTGTVTQLYYILNTGTTAADFSGSVTTTGFTVLWREENITPADVNQDGLTDLIVGRLNGALDYWRNTGTASSPAFTLQQANYLNLTSSVLRQSPSVATGDLNNDGKDELIYGDQTGKVTVIGNYREAADASESKTNIVYNSTLDDYIAQNLGGRIWPTIANLYSFPKPEIVTGNILGGLHILKNRFPTTGLPEETSEPVISVYPNPVSQTQLLTVEVDAPARFQVITALGQPVGPAVQLGPNQPFRQPVDQLKGVYLLKFDIRGKTYGRKIVIR
ncbi:MAG: T9SS type A sorting domain-containing protein [Cyclobacteriaceae bacterium]